MFTIYFFQSRVSVVEAFTMGSNGASGFAGVVNMWIGMIMLIGMIVFLLVQRQKTIKGKKKSVIILFSICSFFYALFYSIFAVFDFGIESVDNIFTLNMVNSEKSDLDDLDEDVKNLYQDYISSIPGEGKDLNVILVFAESLSAVDSARLGGNSNMSGFDAIQRDGVTFANFIANGRSSDTAHIATLLGVLPLININSASSTYEGYKLYMQSLPDFLNDQGYRTIFMSSASLEFLNQRKFLSGAGFQEIIGEEEFKRNKKYTFDAAPDADLFDRVLKEVENQTGKYFIGLQTISFHKPYNTPLGKTEELALKYSDDELYKFYQGLQEIGFFDNGILIILGDHRKMTPSEENEETIFGENWHTRSVATVVGSGINAGEVNSNIIQHTDFYNSIKRLLGSGYVSVDSKYNDVFSGEANRTWGITRGYILGHSAGYTISYLDGSSFSAKNLSNLPNRDGYDYLLSYISFELGDDLDKNVDVGNTNNKTSLIGHRGAPSLAPENSLESFLKAKESGANGIEFDVSYTKDMQNIVAHGEFLSASNCKRRKVWNYSFDRIKNNCTLSNGEKYHGLQEMLEKIDGLFDYYFLEIKVYDEKLGAQQALEAIQTVKDLNMQDRVIFISYSDAARAVLNADPDIIFGRDTFDINDLDFIWSNDSKYFLAPYDLLTSDVVERVRLLGKEIATYTVNDTGAFQDVKNLGINIILTDNISLLKNYENMKDLEIKLRMAIPVCNSGENLD